MMPRKAKEQYLLTLHVIRCCFLALQSSIGGSIPCSKDLYCEFVPWLIEPILASVFTTISVMFQIKPDLIMLSMLMSWLSGSVVPRRWPNIEPTLGWVACAFWTLLTLQTLSATILFYRFYQQFKCQLLGTECVFKRLLSNYYVYE